METWVEEWLKEQRKEGKKRIEIKQSNNAYYVYESTTVWDKVVKRRRKHSSYVGKLDREKGVIKSSRAIVSRIFPRNVWQYGNALLLNRALEPISLLLKESFGDVWEELYAMAMVRVFGYVPLKRIRSKWNKLFNAMRIDPVLDPTHLSDILRIAGTDRNAQRKLFAALMGKEHFAYDLTTVTTRSTLMNIADIGYNRYGEYLPQVNVILLTSVEDNLPSMIRVVPGSIKDVSTLKTSLADVDMAKLTLVMDRGFFSEDNIDEMIHNNVNFIVPARRNSKLYDVAKRKLTGHFFYRNRLIKYRKTVLAKKVLYLFEDTKMREEEEKTIYKLTDNGKRSKDEFAEAIKKAGRILLVSNKNTSEKTIFESWKQREGVEQNFDTFKTTLHSDILYLQDDESVFGHIFVAFLSLYGYCALQNMLRAAYLLDKVSPLDLLEEFSSVYAIGDGERIIVTEVPKKVREFDSALKTNLFPKCRVTEHMP
jgi:transposase